MIDLPGKGVLRFVANHYGRRARCLFVLSTGRVGTTTLAEILHLSNHAEATHEPYPQFLEETFEAWVNFPRRNPDFAASYLKNRVRTLAKNRWRDFVYAECSNRLTYVAYDLLEVLPNAKFIHLHRDPSEVVRSAMRRGYYQKIPSEDSDWGRNRITPRKSDPAWGLWADWTPFQKCCWYWKAINEFAADFVEQAGEKARTVRSSDLFDDPIGYSKEICCWLKIPVPLSQDVESLTTSPSNAMTGGHFAIWDDWTSEQQRQLIRITSKTAERLGYNQYRQSDVGSPLQ